MLLIGLSKLYKSSRRGRLKFNENWRVRIQLTGSFIIGKTKNVADFELQFARMLVNVSFSSHEMNNPVCVQICQKSRRIGCVIPRCKLQCRITQPTLRLF